jgi:UPF0271 protein
MMSNSPGTRIDLNADLAEGFGRWTLGDDAEMLSLVTSANVACGFHAGDPSIMVRTVESAVAGGVAIGAHVAYRDLAGFGRRFVDVAPEELRDDVLYQLSALTGIATALGGTVSYVKPHGALYHAIVGNVGQAAAVVDAIALANANLAVLGLDAGASGSEFLRRASAAGLAVYREAFIDRRYNADGTLVSRKLPGAVITDLAEIADRAEEMVSTGTILAVTGERVVLRADSLCLHGDSPDAVSYAAAVRARLESIGVTVLAFTER